MDIETKALIAAQMADILEILAQLEYTDFDTFKVSMNENDNSIFSFDLTGKSAVLAKEGLKRQLKNELIKLEQNYKLGL